MRVEQMRLELAATLADVGCISAIEEAGLALRRLAGVRASEPDGVLSAPDVEAINCYVDRRRAGEPAQYILGGSEFMGRWFSLNETTYIPRPWTEQMVGRALAILKRSRRPRTVVDVGTGSGAIAAVIAESVRDCHVWALDVDEKALPWARLNTAAAPNVTVLFSDLFDALPPEWAGRVDLVIGSLPYVPSGEMASLPRDYREHEPQTALNGGEDGLSVDRRALTDALRWLRPGGRVFLELGHHQGNLLAAVARSLGYEGVVTEVDGEGDDLFLECSRLKQPAIRRLRSGQKRDLR